jgi:hypothetical protein
LGGSDYSDRVRSWPKFKRTVEQYLPANPKIQLANEDKEFNDFFSTPLTLAESGNPGREILIDVGFTHPTSGDELIRIYTGRLKSVRFNREKFVISAKDKLADLADLQVGTDENPVSFTGVIPSDLFWTLTTCYGRLSTTADSSNPDIDYTAFQTWAAVFSANNVTVDAYFNGQSVNQALAQLTGMTDSAVWDDGSGRLEPAQFSVVSTNDSLLNESQVVGLDIDIDTKRMANKPWVWGDYDTGSKQWGLNVFAISSSSVNSYGQRENILSSPNVWYTSSVDAVNIASRRLNTMSEPPRRFKLNTSGPGLEREITESIRLEDDFMGVDSSDSWRIADLEINLESFTVNMTLDSGVSLNPFILDIDLLDGPKVLT